MAEEANAKKIGLEELMVSTLVMADATVKLLIANVFTDDEFKAQLSTERQLSCCAKRASLKIALCFLYHC